MFFITIPAEKARPYMEKGVTTLAIANPTSDMPAGQT